MLSHWLLIVAFVTLCFLLVVVAVLLLLVVFVGRQLLKRDSRLREFNENNRNSPAAAFGAGLGTAIGNGSLKSFLVVAPLYYLGMWGVRRARERGISMPRLRLPVRRRRRDSSAV